MKKISVLVFCLFACLFAGVFAACGGKEGKIVLETPFENGTVYEYRSGEIDFPAASVVNDAGEVVSYDVTYIVTDGAGESVSSEFPAFSLGVGDYTFAYVYGKQRLEYTFSVKDTTKPEIIFSNIPASLFYEPGMASQALPAYRVEDISFGAKSTVERKLTYRETGGEAQDWEFNAMNNRYEVTGSGIFTYTVTATDDYGNTETAAAEWRVKDYAWIPGTSPAEGILSDFGEEGYLNYVRAGDVNPNYDIGNDFSDSWLSEFEGSEGVLKLDMGFNPATGYNQISLKLAENFSANDLSGGKLLAVRMYLAEQTAQSKVIFGGNQIKTREDGVERALTQSVAGLQAGKWQTFYLTQEQVKRLEMYSQTGNENSAVERLQLCFQQQSAANTRMTLYIDSISIAERLAEPEITTSGRTLSWEAVPGASGYLVEVNGETTFTETTSFELPEGSGYVRVTAAGDGVLTLDSGEVTQLYGIDAAEEYIASFDSALFAELFSTDLNFSTSDDNQGYVPSYWTAEMSGGNFVLELGRSDWGICTGIRFRFPKGFSVHSAEELKIRLKIENTSYNQLRIFDYDNKILLVDYEFSAEEQGKFVTISYDLSQYSASDTLEGLHFIFNGTDNARVVLTLDEIHGETTLAVPVLTDNSDEKTVSWEAIPGAFGYVVRIDGEELPLQAGTSYAYAGKGTIDVKAVGNGISVIDSAFSQSLVFDERQDNPAGGLTGFSWNKDKKILSWNALANTTAYEIRLTKEGENIYAGTQTSFDCSDLGEFKTLFVRALGDDTYRDSEWVELLWLGDTLCTVEGELLFQAIRDGSSSYLQFDQSLDFTAGKLDFSYVNATLNGEPHSLQGQYHEIGVLQFDGAFEEGDVLRVFAGSAVYQSGRAFVFAEDIALVFVGGNDWCFLAGNFAITEIGYATDALIQIPNMALEFEGDESAGTVIGFWGNATLGGSPVSVVATFFSPSTLMFSGQFSAGKLLTLPKGSVIYQNKKAYLLFADTNLLYDGLSWKIVSVAGHITFDEIESDSAESFSVAASLGFEDGAIDLSLAEIFVDGQKIEASAVYAEGKLTFTLPADTVTAGKLCSLSIRAGSLFRQGDRYYALAEEFGVISGGGAWSGITGSLSLTGAGYTTNTVIQISKEIAGFVQGDLDTSSVHAEMNGEAYTLSTITYHADAKILQFETMGYTPVQGDVLTVKAGSVFWQNNSYYVLEQDYSAVFVGETATGCWKFLNGFVELNDTLEYNAATVIQCRPAGGMAFAGEDGEWVTSIQSLSAMQYTGDIQTVTMSYSTTGVLQFGGFTAQEGDTFQVAKGSVITNGTLYYVVASDFSVTFDGSAWH